jgi:hypothetical protein
MRVVEEAVARGPKRATRQAQNALEERREWAGAALGLCLAIPVALVPGRVGSERVRFHVGENMRLRLAE